jgi:hypothetical protein
MVANRQNALKSSGPQTPEGKSIAKLNALRHGILAKEVVIQGENIRESTREFRAVLARFWQDLVPIGAVEEMLVERIATSYWRLRRVLISEAGEIKLAVDAASWRRLMQRCDQVLDLKRAKFIHKESDYKKSAFGVRYLVEKLEEIRALVEDAGGMEDAILRQVEEVFGDEEDGLFRALGVANAIFQNNPEGLELEALKAHHKSAALNVIDTHLKTLKGLLSMMDENEGNEEDARIDADLLPSKEAAEKLLRYETTLERQIYRALNQLERLQRQRRGDLVPPPVSIEVSTDS